MRRFLSFLFVCPTLFLSAQRLVGADAVYTSSAVVIRFTLAAGASCSGYSIMHCLDSVSFVNVYEDFTGCSASNEPAQFSYAHTSFVPDVVNYYRVRLDGWESSPTLRIFPSKSGRGGLTLYPNPMGPSDNLLNLNLLGTNNTKLWGYLYSRFGETKQELSFQTDGTKVQLNVGDLAQGVYVLWLTDGNTVFSGKLIALD